MFVLVALRVILSTYIVAHSFIEPVVLISCYANCQLAVNVCRFALICDRIETNILCQSKIAGDLCRKIPTVLLVFYICAPGGFSRGL